MVDNNQVLALPQGATISFKYRFPSTGPYERQGVVDRVRNLGMDNMIRGGKLRLYGVKPIRPKGKVLVTIFDNTVGDYRSFYTEYMDNLKVT